MIESEPIKIITNSGVFGMQYTPLCMAVVHSDRGNYAPTGYFGNWGKGPDLWDRCGTNKNYQAVASSTLKRNYAA